MNHDERQFEQFVRGIKFDDAADAGHRDKLEQDLLTALAKQPGQMKFWRMIMKSQITKLAAAAVIVLAIITGAVQLGKPVGASAAFAAAMDNLKGAGTFSCTEIFEMAYEDGGKRGKYLVKQKWMFKEPDWERHETLTSPWPKYVGEITITDYGSRKQLLLRPVEKIAQLSDLRSDYTIDDKTGQLKPTQLNTRLRDRLLTWSAEAVRDLGRVELDGKSVRMLQSQKDKRVTTVWVDPGTNYPVQMEHKWLDQSRSPVMFTSIQIDAELDDDIFSLEPPEGYALSVDKPGWPDYKKKIMTKVMYLGLQCVIYADKHDGHFPDKLADLVTAGVIRDDALNRVVAGPDDPNGPAVIRYRKPDTTGKDRSRQVVLYEIYDRWPQDGVVACFADSHCELIRDRNRFEELIK